jgi:putative nucleotidyltransferase with HDIG domain
MESRFSDLIILLASGINQRIMYFDSHPTVQSLSRDFVARLARALEDSGQTHFSFGVHNGKFIRNGKYLVGPSIAGRSLIRFAERLNCGGFTFTLPLSPEDLVTFYRLAAQQKLTASGVEEARRLLAGSGLETIEPNHPYVEEGDGNQTGAEDGGPDDLEAREGKDYLAADFAPLLQVYQALYDTVSGNSRAVHGDTRLNLDEARTRGEELVLVSDRGALDVMQFMRYPDYDSYTIGHSVRVAALAALVGRELNWSPEQRSEVATAGLLHDLGKGKIPEDILFKPGKLDGDERRIMETHPVLGVKILLANGEKSSTVISAAWGHHLRHDGKGYPAMPGNYANSTAAELIHVCDVFEALTAARPYKLPLPPRRAYEIMLADKGAFDPRLLSALIRSMGLYPPGSEVRLTDNRQAVVVNRGRDLESPLVRVTHGPDGRALPRENQPALQLGPQQQIRVQDFLTVALSEEATGGADWSLAGSFY